MSNSNLKLIKLACYMGYIIQAIVINLSPILFTTLIDEFKFSYSNLSILIITNFITQILCNIFLFHAVKKFGFKPFALIANIFCFLGFISFSITPYIFRTFPFLMFIFSTIIFSIGGGIFQLILSPIIHSLESDNKHSSMSLLHSFYAWGQVSIILLTTFYFFIFGKENWRFIVLFWCIVPIINFFIFLKTTLEFKQEDDEIHFLKLIKHPTFIIALIAIASGAATELVINQWISIFIKKGLNLSIIFSNLVGMCGFALMLGAGRLLFGLLGKKLNIYNLMISGSILSIIAYLIIGFSSSKWISIISCILCGLLTSILWPGTLTTTSEKIPKHGISLFAFLAASGDIGAGFAPWLLGFLTTKFTSNMFDIQSSLKFSLLIVTIFPIITLITLIKLKLKK
ncbi:MFS transporter [uncultured Clostridium sp.]|uniref:MFS transporter n=1 Tax=uncultured Clostridium sp. TaxID=59620 RepID=UPI00260ABFDD|nr:MFS transporter [uncultured Clostridium sp.]